MDKQAVVEALRQTAQRLSEDIRSRQLVQRAIGPALGRRLALADWIKSPLLASFLLPVTPPGIWQPSREDVARISARWAELEPGATTLDIFESLLAGFDARSVGGVELWFKEVGNARRYWFDRRYQCLNFELAMAGLMMDWAQVTKLATGQPEKRPDFTAETPDVTLVVDCKLLLGRGWPLKVIYTMLDVLVKGLGIGEVDQVFVHATRMDVVPQMLEKDVAGLSVEALLDAVAAVASGVEREVELTPTLRMVARTARERSLPMRAFLARPSGGFPTHDPAFEYLGASLERIQAACAEAWDQCSAYCGDASPLKRRLDVAAIAGEYLMGHPDFSPVQREVLGWLRREVWPSTPERAVVMSFGEMVHPVWFVSGSS